MTGRGLRLGLLTGTGRVLSGVLGAGLFTYLFLGLAGRVLGPEEFAPVSTLWALVFILGPGFFLPVQQELGRLLAHRRDARAGRTTLSRIGLLALGTAGVVVAWCVALRPWLTRELFAGDPLLFWCLPASVAAYAVTYVVRGVLSGVGDYAGLGRLIALESLARLLVASGVVLAGVRSPGAFGIAIATAPLISAAAVTRSGGSRLRLRPDVPAGWRATARSLGWLVTAALAAQALANAGPLLVQALASPTEENQAGRFLSALVLSRVGLYLFQAVQATLLPNSAAVLAGGRPGEVLADLRRITAACAVLVVVTTGGAWAVGPTVVSLLFGEAFTVSRSTMAVLTAASGCYVLALASSSTAVAAGAYRLGAGAWLAGCAAFAGTAAVLEDLFLRVEVGYLVGSVVTALVLLLGVPRAVHRSPPAALPSSRGHG